MATNVRQGTTLLFVHVPKCAGTTLRTIVEQQYLGQGLFVIHHDIGAEARRLERMGEQERRRLRAVFGHMCWGWHNRLAPGQPHAYITMLRHPVERVLSLYAHSRLKEHYLGKEVGRMDLATYLTSGVTCTPDNGIVRQLCGRDAFLQTPWKDMVIPHGEVTRADLDAAKEHLRQCAVVGLSERFDDFVEVMGRRYAWRVGTYQWANVTRWSRLSQDSLDARAWAAMEQATELDRELYALAQELVEGQA